MLYTTQQSNHIDVHWSFEERCRGYVVWVMMKGTLGLKKGSLPFKNDRETTLTTHLWNTTHLPIAPRMMKIGYLKPFVRALLFCWEPTKVDDAIEGEITGMIVVCWQDHIEREGWSHGGKKLQSEKDYRLAASILNCFSRFELLFVTLKEEKMWGSMNICSLFVPKKTWE